MKKISRKGFLKVAAAAAMSGVTASALAASAPIKPDFDPPYTSALPLSPIQRPSSSTACRKDVSLPSFAPR